MSCRLSSTLSGLFAVLAIILLVTPVRAAWQESYCSSQNTGSTGVYSWDFQSNGNCTGHCGQVGNYAFAVIQWKDCYCSDYIPSQQASINRCQKDCPGFPDEHCGSLEDNLYIYIRMSGQPSGTAGGSQPSSTIVSSSPPPPVTTQAPPSSQVITPSPAAPSQRVSTSLRLPGTTTIVNMMVIVPPVITVPSSAPPSQVFTSVRPPGTTTLVQTIVSTLPVITVQPSTPASTAPTTSAPTTSTAFTYSSSTASARPSSKPQSSQTSEDPQTSIQVITQSGAIVTRTILQTPTSNPTASAAPLTPESVNSGPNVGAIAGGVAGGVIGLLAIIGVLIFFLWRRRKQQREAHDDGSMSNGDGSGGITRNTSTMSKAGLLGGATEIEHQYPPRIATNFSTQNSRYGTDHESISPISTRRNSQPLMIDSRLNPNAVITFAGANASRESVASLDDSRDYGRQLNVRNPDP